MFNTDGRFGENCYFIDKPLYSFLSRVRLKCDGTHAETSRLLAAEVCASAVVMLDTSCS
jgi:hypothetical protein